jgi:hypothetical protein
MRNTDMTGGKSQSISGGSAVNPLVAFYDIHGRKSPLSFFRECYNAILIFFPGLHARPKFLANYFSYNILLPALFPVHLVGAACIIF